MTCGASAGLAAAFHAPLAGMMFALEEIHKGFSVSILISVMTASVTADYISSYIIGLDPVFQFRLEHVLPQEYYWMLILLGAVLGVMGAFYNKLMLKAQELYKKPSFLNETGRLVIAFLAAGIIALVMPSVLGSGGNLIVSLTEGEMGLKLVLLTFVVKLLFSAVSFGSGAPGGIFFPLLILGAFIGGIFTCAGHALFGIDMMYLNNFVLLAMAGYFTAIVRAPLTGIILIFEMTGTVSQLFSLAVVSICAYIVATLMRSEPIYESLLAGLLKRRGEIPAEGGEKVLREFVVSQGSLAAGKKVRELEWPRESLLVAVKRGDNELIPKGSTRLLPGDSLVVMADEYDSPDIMGQMERICGEQI